MAGDGLATGPGASFFFLLSGLHGLHIIGGLAALALVVSQAAREPGRAGAGTALCVTYWDFLLVVWLGLMILFMGWANQLVDICRNILT
jgi:cytochrome c oxidase subunit 3